MSQAAFDRAIRILRESCVLIITVGLACGPTPAICDEAPNLLEAPFHVAFGMFVVDSQPTARLDGDTETGTPVDLDRTFRTRYPNRARLDGDWRFAKRHKALISAFEARSSGRRVIEEDIVWDGETYPTHSTVDASWEFSIVEVAYEYTFRRRDNYELAASFGLHVTKFNASFNASAQLSGGRLAEDLSGSGEFGAPLPVIGLHGLWALPHDLWIDASAQYFALSIDEYHGSVQGYKVLLTWQPKKWLGLGIGYNRFSVDVNLDTHGFHGSLDWIYQGPIVFYSAAF